MKHLSDALTCALGLQKQPLFTVIQGIPNTTLNKVVTKERGVLESYNKKDFIPSSKQGEFLSTLRVFYPRTIT